MRRQTKLLLLYSSSSLYHCLVTELCNNTARAISRDFSLYQPLARSALQDVTNLRIDMCNDDTFLRCIDWLILSREKILSLSHGFTVVYPFAIDYSPTHQTKKKMCTPLRQLLSLRTFTYSTTCTPAA